MSLLFLTKGQQYSFQNYSVSEGLAQSQVYTMIEDHKGFLWLGTNGGGLSRFDGQKFETFSTRHGISDNHINNLFEDKSGNIWVATRNGLDRFDGRKWLSVDLPIKGKLGITCLLEDQEDQLWVGSSQGIFCRRNGQWVDTDTLNKQAANLMFLDREGRLWVGLRRGIMCREKGTWKDLNELGILNRAQITGFAEDSIGHIWIATYNSGLFHFDGKRVRRVLRDQSELNGALYFDLLFDKEGKLWLATQNKGVIRWDGKDSVLTRLGKKDGLANDHVRCLLEDRWGILWLGTSGGGLSKYAGQQFVQYGPTQGILEQAYSVIEDYECNLWVGNSNRGITIIGPDSIVRLDRQHGFLDTKVKSLYEDEKYQIWVGTDGKGLYRIDQDTMINITASTGLGSNWVRDITEDDKGRMFVATAGGGICRMTPVDTNQYAYRYKQYRHSLDCPERINTIHFDKWDRLWFGSVNEGLGYIRSDSILVFVKIGEGRGLQTIRAIEEDEQGLLWIGTEGGGVVSLDIYAQSDTFLRKTYKNNLTIGPNYFLKVDALGYLWIGNNKGVDRATLAENGDIIEIKHFGKSEGFLGTETTQNAVTEDREGNLYFGTIRGLMRFNLGQGLRNPIAPIISIRDVNLFYEPLASGAYQSWAAADMGIAPGLKLPHKQNHLGFDFIGINHPNPEQVKYQWRLLGEERRWSPVSSKNSATYSNLQPGSYRFQLKAVNEDGVWSQILSTPPFEIQPPYWQRWWFMAALIAFFITILAIFIRLRINQVRAKARIQQQQLEMENAVLELEQKALRLQMNPHFIFNALNSIQGLIATKDTKAARYYLAKFSKLMRRVLENSRETHISLEREIESLEVYLDLERFCGGEQFEYEVKVDDALQTEETLIPPMLIQPFVENAIIHGINHLDTRKGKISLSFMREDEVLVCGIQDNGIGREEARKINRHRVPGHKSTALAVTKERLSFLQETHGGEDIGLEIQDLLDEKGKGMGTAVVIRIPLIEDW